jgi:hypothetical protein
MLSAAAQREDRCLIAHPILRAARRKRLRQNSLTLVSPKEIKAKPGAPVWRQDERAGQLYELKVTAAGVKAIAADNRSASDDRSENNREPGLVAAANSEIIRQITAEVPTAVGTRSSSPRGGMKLARVLELHQRDCGATLEELIAATGWLPHATRAALTGLRKRGYAVTIDRFDKERGSTYCVQSDETINVEQTGSQIDESPRISAARKSHKAQRLENPQAQQVP